MDKKRYEDFELRCHALISKKELVCNINNIVANSMLYNYLDVFNGEVMPLYVIQKIFFACKKAQRYIDKDFEILRKC